MVQFIATIQQFEEKGEKTGWSYVTIPADIAEKLKPGFKKSFRVKGKLDAHPIAQMALIPMGNGEFILALKASLRRAIHKNKGAMVKLIIEEDKKPLKVLPELLECLSYSVTAEKKFKSLPHSHQMYYSNWIGSAKTVETRAKRIGLTILAMEKNLTYGEMMKLNTQTVNK
ncbi:MAG: YdeI/OmpD-associated family protein [Bacteroidota bacterium]|nr:YdeI/OmpD-associated family protein [Bacteroidota bacterium]